MSLLEAGMGRLMDRLSLIRHLLIGSSRSNGDSVELKMKVLLTLARGSSGLGSALLAALGV
jgi:hypothetical protein